MEAACIECAQGGLKYFARLWDADVTYYCLFFLICLGILAEMLRVSGFVEGGIF